MCTKDDMQERHREAQERVIAAMHAHAAAIEANATALGKMADQIAPECEWYYQRGTPAEGFQPVAPAGDGWSLHTWHQDRGDVAYMWRRLAPVFQSTDGEVKP